MFSPGSLVDIRHHIADIGRRLPTLTGFGMTSRWLAWKAYSGPVDAVGWIFGLAHVIGIAALLVVRWFPFGATWSAAVGWWDLVQAGAGWHAAAGAGVVAGTFGVAAWFFTRDDLKVPWDTGEKWTTVTVPGPRKVKRVLFSRPGRWGMWLFAFTLAAFTVGGYYVLALLGFAVVMKAADVVMAEANDWYDGRAQYGKFRQEFSIQWAIIASKSRKVQSITDTSGESNVADLAVSRPILEAPPQWTIPRQVSAYVFEWPVWRSPGRGLIELADVRDELAAQFTFVEDWEDSIELIWPERDGTNFASWAWLRVHFKNRATRRDPFGKGANARPISRAARWLQGRRTPAFGPLSDQQAA